MRLAGLREFNTCLSAFPLEAHFLGDVAFAVVEVARPDAAVFVGKGAPAVAIEVVPAVVGGCDGLAWTGWDGDCRYGFNSCLRTFYLGWRLVSCLNR